MTVTDRLTPDSAALTEPAPPPARPDVIVLDPVPPARPDAVVLEGVSKRYGHRGAGVAALDQVSLRVPAGEFLCLVGASGCGKSTLLNLVAALDQPSEGTLERAGGPVAVMFQEAALFPWLTVARNVELAI